MRKVASRITFVGCDVAYDVRNFIGKCHRHPYRYAAEMTHEGTTRYFGKAHQRKTNGYCRIYDKRLELWEQQKIMLDHELSRIEIVYKPDQKILLSDVGRYPPEQNDKYFAAVVTDWDVLPRKRVEQIRNMRDGAEMYTQRIRKGVKETLANPYHVDFNRLAREQWVSLVEVPCAALLGGSVNRRFNSDWCNDFVYTVYDLPTDENDNKIRVVQILENIVYYASLFPVGVREG
ncbi:hypothetical protein ACFCP7_28000 [Paenibacillus elgii]